MKKLPSDDGWCFEAFLDGDDVVIPSTTATWFGGDNDPDDNGETASGVKTAGNPDCMGCALPVVQRCSSTAGSPFSANGKIPWHTPVRIMIGDKSITVPLIDNGPAKWAQDGIDLTQAAFRCFAPIAQGQLKGVTVRILGAAKHLMHG